MAGRTFNNNTLTVEQGAVHIFAQVAIGATGAATLTRGKGITSVTRTATGIYDVVLADKYRRLLFAAGTLLRATAIAANVQLEAETVSTNGTVCFQVTSIGASPALADPTSGDVLRLHMVLGNTVD